MASTTRNPSADLVTMPAGHSGESGVGGHVRRVHDQRPERVTNQRMRRDGAVRVGRYQAAEPVTDRRLRSGRRPPGQSSGKGLVPGDGEHRLGRHRPREQGYRRREIPVRLAEPVRVEPQYPADPGAGTRGRGQFVLQGDQVARGRAAGQGRGHYSDRQGVPIHRANQASSGGFIEPSASGREQQRRALGGSERRHVQHPRAVAVVGFQVGEGEPAGQDHQANPAQRQAPVRTSRSVPSSRRPNPSPAGPSWMTSRPSSTSSSGTARSSARTMFAGVSAATRTPSLFPAQSSRAPAQCSADGSA